MPGTTTKPNRTAKKPLPRALEFIDEARDAGEELGDVDRARLDLIHAGLNEIKRPNALLDEVAYHLETLARHVDESDVTFPVRNALQLVEGVRSGDLHIDGGEF